MVFEAKIPKFSSAAGQNVWGGVIADWSQIRDMSPLGKISNRAKGGGISYGIPLISILVLALRSSRFSPLFGQEKVTNTTIRQSVLKQSANKHLKKQQSNNPYRPTTIFRQVKQSDNPTIRLKFSSPKNNNPTIRHSVRP